MASRDCSWWYRISSSVCTGCWALTWHTWDRRHSGHAWTRHTLPSPHHSLQPHELLAAPERLCCRVSHQQCPGPAPASSVLHSTLPSPNYSRLITAPLCRSGGHREPNQGSLIGRDASKRQPERRSLNEPGVSLGKETAAVCEGSREGEGVRNNCTVMAPRRGRPGPRAEHVTSSPM